MRTLLMVGGLDEWVVKAKRLGLTLVLLQHPDKVTELQERTADVLRVVDYTRWELVEPVVRELHATPGFTAATSLTEPGLEIAGRINDRYGLGGTGYDVARRLRDKAEMRRWLADIDPAAVAAEPLRDEADLADFGARHGYPFIVKPVDATASVGVLRVDDPAGCPCAWSHVSGLRDTRTDRVSTMYLLRDFLMEEYVDGAEYSVEGFSFAGRHVIVAITEKFTEPGHFAELGHALPARLPEEVAEQIRGYVGRFLGLVGFADGPTHTEVRVGAKGVRVIESHNRAGGDAIAELVEGAYGIDLATLALGWPFRLVDELPDRPVAHCGASTRFLIGEPGEVVAVDGVEAARQSPGVLAVRLSAKPGDPVRALRDNWDRLGLVAATGADTTAAVEYGARLIENVLDVRLRGADGRPGRAYPAPVAGQPVVTVP